MHRLHAPGPHSLRGLVVRDRSGTRQQRALQGAQSGCSSLLLGYGVTSVDGGADPLPSTVAPSMMGMIT